VDIVVTTLVVFRYTLELKCRNRVIAQMKMHVSIGDDEKHKGLNG
jgi:hypothetical protein